MNKFPYDLNNVQRFTQEQIETKNIKESPIVWAINNYQQLYLQKLILRGFRKDLLFNNSTLLHIAASKSNLDALVLLLEYGLSPTIRDTNGFTIFHIFLHNSREDLFMFIWPRILATHRETIMQYQDVSGDYLVHCAAKFGSFAVTFFAEQFSVKNAKNLVPFESLLTSKEGLLNEPTTIMNIFLATQGRSILERRDLHGNILHLLAKGDYPMKLVVVLNYLLPEPDLIMTLIQEPDQHGSTPLHLSASFPSSSLCYFVDALSILDRKHLLHELRNDEGLTVLDIAMRTDKLNTLLILKHAQKIQFNESSLKLCDHSTLITYKKFTHSPKLWLSATPPGTLQFSLHVLGAIAVFFGWLFTIGFANPVPFLAVISSFSILFLILLGIVRLSNPGRITEPYFSDEKTILLND